MRDRVRLRITDSLDPDRSETLWMPRERAELLARRGLDQWWPHFTISIDSPEDRMNLAAILAVLESGLALAKAYAGVFALAAIAVLAALSVYLPSSTARVFPVVALALLCLGSGIAVSKADPIP